MAAPRWGAGRLAGGRVRVRVRGHVRLSPVGAWRRVARAARYCLPARTRVCLTVRTKRTNSSRDSRE